ncbi:MAG: GNAT family N-acetyltransferase [Rhizobiales bacterium]|nr:GNAT family N-acetyltransferase [Hyphomicrobiales bacterium]
MPRVAGYRGELISRPLRTDERGPLANALARAGLPVDDLDVPGRLFFRFETSNATPVGYGGLEILGADALLRSVVTLPPARRQGIGSAIVAALEAEAITYRCRAIYILTADAADFFLRLGYAKCARAEVPEEIRATKQFSALCPANADVMVKRIS